MLLIYISNSDLLFTTGEPSRRRLMASALSLTAPVTVFFTFTFRRKTKHCLPVTLNFDLRPW